MGLRRRRAGRRRGLESAGRGRRLRQARRCPAWVGFLAFLGVAYLIYRTALKAGGRARRTRHRQDVKVAFIGTHGVGKTTLCYDLAGGAEAPAASHVDMVKEVARLSPLPINRKTSLDAQTWILMTQVAEEIRSAAYHEVVVCDRSALDNYAYMALACGRQKPFERFVAHWMKTYDLLFKVPISGAASADGVRDTDEFFMRSIDALVDTLLAEMKVAAPGAAAGRPRAVDRARARRGPEAAGAVAAVPLAACAPSPALTTFRPCTKPQPFHERLTAVAFDVRPPSGSRPTPGAATAGSSPGWRSPPAHRLRRLRPVLLPEGRRSGRPACPAARPVAAAPRPRAALHGAGSSSSSCRPGSSRDAASRCTAASATARRGWRS